MQRIPAACHRSLRRSSLNAQTALKGQPVSTGWPEFVPTIAACSCSESSDLSQTRSACPRNPRNVYQRDLFCVSCATAEELCGNCASKQLGSRPCQSHSVAEVGLKCCVPVLDTGTQNLKTPAGQSLCNCFKAGIADVCSRLREQFRSLPSETASAPSPITQGSVRALNHSTQMKSQKNQGLDLYN